MYYADALSYVSSVLSVNERYSDFFKSCEGLVGEVSARDLNALSLIVSDSCTVGRGFLGIFEGDVLNSDFYFTNSELVGVEKRLDSGFSCFSAVEFGFLEYSGDVCFFKVSALDYEDAIAIFDGLRGFVGGIGVIKSFR